MGVQQEVVRLQFKVSLVKRLLSVTKLVGYYKSRIQMCVCIKSKIKIIEFLNSRIDSEG